MTKHRLHQIQLAQNGCEETQKFLDAIGIDWDNGEPINNGLTDTQADFLSPKQFARPKEKRLNGWQKTNNAMPIKRSQILPDCLFEGK